MRRHPALAVSIGALAVIGLGILGGTAADDHLADGLEAQATQVIATTGASPVTAQFRTRGGWPTRHPLLDGGQGLNLGVRAKVARAVAAIPGVGGVQWTDGTFFAQRDTPQYQPLHCQDDVDALLRARTIRFEEGSARIDKASRELVDEVATALRPCLGSIIAINGHTDNSGPEPGNLALSQERADAVEQALVARGIPADGLRARGVGSSQPVEGLDPTDPANRRIEFSVIATQALVPTPVDTPGAQ